MHKSPLRPLRLKRVDAPLHTRSLSARKCRGDNKGSIHEFEELAGCMKYDTHVLLERNRTLPMDNSNSKQTRQDITTQHSLERTPHNYLFSQAYGFWLYLTLFLVTWIVTRATSPTEYGTYVTLQTAINTIIYVVTLGLEDAAVTFLPRISLERGQAAGAYLIKQLLILRALILLLTASAVVFALPTLAYLINLLPIPGFHAVSLSLQTSTFQTYALPIALYILGSGITNLLQSVCAAQMRMLHVLIVGGGIQLGLVISSFVVWNLNWGLNAIIWMQGVIAALGAIIFLLWLSPSFLGHKAEWRQPFRPVLQVGASAWLTNLVSGALLKQVSLSLLMFYAISEATIGYFNLSFQLADAANILLVSGFAGVGASALATSFVGKNYDRLGHSWHILIKVETLIATPGLIFCLFNSQAVAIALYGTQFAAVGPLLAIFLAFNLFFRVIGSTIHQSSLYVIGKPYVVVISQWVSLLLIIALGVILIPQFGAAGALIADGTAKIFTGACMLAILVRKFPRNYSLGLLNFTLRLLLTLTIAVVLNAVLQSLLILVGIFHTIEPLQRVVLNAVLQSLPTPAMATIPMFHLSPLTIRIELGISAIAFLLLCLGTMLIIKPFNSDDLRLIATMRPALARYARWFVKE
jgi:O-antigen/teichoic acid export membrane protein